MLTLASLLTFSFSSCEKDDDTATSSQGGGQPVVTVPDLAGTSWVCSMENSTSMQGVPVNISIDATLDFTDETSGEYFQMASVEFPQFPDYNQNNDQTFVFTYTVSGGKILITYTYTDEESQEDVTETVELLYDPATDTIYMDANSPEMEQMLGTDIYRFTRVQ